MKKNREGDKIYDTRSVVVILSGKLHADASVLRALRVKIPICVDCYFGSHSIVSISFFNFVHTTLDSI